MTPDDFRRIALALPEVLESAHHGHPDFRIRNRVFATLGWPDEDWGMVKLRPDEQEVLTAAAPEVFEPVPGGWGRKGATQVRLARAEPSHVEGAMAIAWRAAAPNTLAATLAR